MGDIQIKDIIEIEDERTQEGEKPFQQHEALRNFRGNYGVPRKEGNTVYKGFFKTDTQTIDKLTKLQEMYHGETAKFIPVIPTHLHMEEDLFYLTQEFIPGYTLETYMKSRARLGNKMDAYQTILDQALRVVTQIGKKHGGTSNADLRTIAYRKAS